MEHVTREIEVDAAASDVWDALTEFGEWFGADVEGVIDIGEVVRFTWPDGAERRAIVERVVPEKELAFRWLPTLEEPPSRVEITIDGTDETSVVRVVERRFDAAVTPVPQIGFRALARV